MKQFIKPIVIVVLLAILASVLIIPTSLPAKEQRIPGTMTLGEYGWSCLCPMFWTWPCYCVIMSPPVE